MASSSASKFPTKLIEATEAGDKFVKLFYETFDKRRQVREASLLRIYAQGESSNKRTPWTAGNKGTLF